MSMILFYLMCQSVLFFSWLVSRDKKKADSSGQSSQRSLSAIATVIISGIKCRGMNWYEMSLNVIKCH